MSKDKHTHKWEYRSGIEQESHDLGTSFDPVWWFACDCGDEMDVEEIERRLNTVEDFVVRSEPQGREGVFGG